MISLYVNAVDQSSQVLFGSLQKDDILNERTDSLKFSVRKYPGSSFSPALGQEVELFQDAALVFGGVIMRIGERVEGDRILVYDIECNDYSQYLDRNLVVERFEGMTVDAILAYLLTTYAPAFTGAGVNCTIPITTITFDRISMSEAIQKLAELTNYSWYVDYDLDLHFFEKNEEPAPFNITDTSDNYIFDTLAIEQDLTQLRNRVFIRGGEVEGSARSESFNGDGVKLTFPLGNKFSGVPTVTVGGVAKTVGIDFLDQETAFDAFWSYQEKYIRFKSGTVPPAGTNNVVVAGIPLFTLVMRVEDSASIATYGVYEFAKTDRSIKSKEEAKRFGIAQLEAYAQGIVEGSFDTYTSGLRSGQIINVTSALRGIDEDFLIQRVSFSMLGKDNYVWSVQLASLRTMGIIEFLIDLLKGGQESAGEASTELLEKVLFESEEIVNTESVIASKVHNPLTEAITDTEATSASKTLATVFVAGDYTPSSFSDVKRVFILDGSRLG